jgi:hypothetical protein
MQTQTPRTICTPQQHHHTTSQASLNSTSPTTTSAVSNSAVACGRRSGQQDNAIPPPLTASMSAHNPNSPWYPHPALFPSMSGRNACAATKHHAQASSQTPPLAKTHASHTHRPRIPRPTRNRASTAACNPLNTSQPPGHITPPLHTPPRQSSSPRTLAPFQGQDCPSNPCPFPTPRTPHNAIPSAAGLKIAPL